MACVLDFYAVIKDGNADATTWRIQQSMTKCIRQCFTQCLYRNLQSFFSTHSLRYCYLNLNLDSNLESGYDCSRPFSL